MGNQVLFEVESFLTFTPKGARLLSLWLWFPCFYPMSDKQKKKANDFIEEQRKRWRALKVKEWHVGGEDFGPVPFFGYSARIEYFNESTILESVFTWLDQTAVRTERKLPKVRMRGARPENYHHWILRS